MDKARFFKELHSTDKAFPGVLAHMSQQHSKQVKALGLAGLEYIRNQEVTPEIKALIAAINKSIAVAKKHSMDTTPFVAQIESLKSTSNAVALAWTTYRANIKIGAQEKDTDDTDKASYRMPNSVLQVNFANLGIFTRFVSVSETEWYVFAVNMGTKQAMLVLASSELELVAGNSTSVRSPTRARLLVKAFYAGYPKDSNQTGKEAVESLLNAGFKAYNAGGVGLSTKYHFGASAILIKESASGLLPEYQSGKLPEENPWTRAAWDLHIKAGKAVKAILDTEEKA